MSCLMKLAWLFESPLYLNEESRGVRVRAFVTVNCISTLAGLKCTKRAADH